MPSPTISHMILTVSLLVLFLVISYSIQGVVVEYRNTLARDEAEEILDRVYSQLTTAILTLQRLGSENTTLALEVSRHSPLQTDFYTITLLPADGGVKVKITHEKTGGYVEGSTIVGCSLPNSTLINLISQDLLSPIGVNIIDDGREIYTGVNGTVVVWAVKIGGTIYVGLGWIAQ